MNDADKAYAAAEAEIEKAARDGDARLSFDSAKFRALTRLPPGISKLEGLTLLDLDNTRITDLTPLAGMTGIKTLGLHNTQITDLTPLAGMTGIKTLYLNDTQITDLTPLAGMTGIKTLTLGNTQITDLTPLAGMTGITGLNLGNTQITDLTPLAGMTGITTLGLENTQITDLRPLTHLRQLAENPRLSGLTFKNCRAAQLDSRIAEIAEIKNIAKRAQTLFDYLNDGWVPPVDPDAKPERADIEDAVILPERRPAPLEIDVSETRLSIAHKDGLPQSDANDRAAMGWEAIKDYRDDFAGSFNVSNYAPLPRYLDAFDRAMGTGYDPASVIRIGVQAQRFVALSNDVAFLATLPDGAPGDLKTFASEVLVYLNRFPDWVAYRDDAELKAPDDVREAADDFKAISEALNNTLGADSDLKEEYAAEVAEGTDDAASDIEAKALFVSTSEMPVRIAEYERGQREMRRELAKKGGDLIDSSARGVVGIPFAFMMSVEKPMRNLANRFPTRMGWINTWYDANFGSEDER